VPPSLRGGDTGHGAVPPVAGAGSVTLGDARSARSVPPAKGRHDLLAVVGLFLAAVAGSVLGDLLVFALGRSSHELVARSCHGGLALWVRRHLVRRPGVALVGARFVPGGRLVSTAAAGRFGLSLRPFLLWSLASSAVWSGYMLAVGILLGPLTGGNPLLSLAAGLVMATATAAGFALAARLRRPRRTWAVHVRVPEAVPAG
jgi:membrane-associated protein